MAVARYECDGWFHHAHRLGISESVCGAGVEIRADSCFFALMDARGAVHAGGNVSLFALCCSLLLSWRLHWADGKGHCMSCTCGAQVQRHSTQTREAN